MLEALAFALEDAASAWDCACTVSTGILWSLPPYRPSTGALRSETTSAGYWGCKSSLSPTNLPYQATPALSDFCWAAYSQTMRPPQQKPVMDSFEVSACGSFLVKATAASRSDMTWASGTLDTTLLKISFMSVSLETSPWRANSSGAIA